MARRAFLLVVALLMSLCVVTQAWAADLDLTFGDDGIVTTGLAYGPVWANGVVVDDAGRIVVVGTLHRDESDILVARYLPDGTLDPTFGVAGRFVIDLAPTVTYDSEYPLAVAIQPDGKIVVVGVSWGAMALRLNTDGTLDSGFGSGGVVKLAWGSPIDPGWAYRAEDVAVRPDGKILMATDEAGYGFGVWRLNSDGSMDTTFSGDGKTLVPVGTDATSTYALGLRADGGVVVGGYAEEGSVSRFGVVSLLPDGTPDPGFDGDGIVLTPVGSGNDPRLADLAVAPDGKIVAVGIATGSGADMAAVRYLATGALDSSFDGDGKVLVDGPGTGFDNDDEARSVAIAPSGAVVLTGRLDGEGLGVARLSAGGALDAAFGGDGLVHVPTTGDGVAVALQSDARVVTASSAETLDVIRFSTDGSLDPTFDDDGIAQGAGTHGDDEGSSIAVQPDGKIVVGGRTADHGLIVRYRPGGTLDTTFGSGGVTRITSDPVEDVAIAPDGGIIVATGGEVRRFDATGALDTTFGSGGSVVGPHGAGSIAIEADGDILVTGMNAAYVSKFTPAGVLDPTFGQGGTTEFAPIGRTRGIAIAPDDGIVVVGEGHTSSGRADLGVVRFTPAGVWDQSFGTDGICNLNFAGYLGNPNDHGEGVAVLADGTIVVAGWSETYFGDAFVWAGLHPDGSIDETWGKGGISRSGESYSYDVVAVPSGAVAVGTVGDDFVSAWLAPGAVVVEVTSVGPGQDVAHSVARAPNGGILVAGGTATPDTSLDVAVARYAGPGGAPPETSISDGPADPVRSDSATFRYTSSLSDHPIAFRSVRDGDADIFTANPDGTNTTKLTMTTSDESGPTWSPDGTRIAFSSNADGLEDLYVMNADGAGVGRIGDAPGQNWSPAWSPDGTRIAYVSNRGGDDEIYVVDADGTHDTRLTTVPGMNADPTWSPNGGKLAYTGPGTDLDVFVQPADGGTQEPLTDAVGNDVHPAWSPDGTRIAFVATRDGNHEVYVMDADGSDEVRLTDDAAADDHPAWSPDGSRIVFTSDRDGNEELYSMQPDGTDVVRVTTDGAPDREGAWAPPYGVFRCALDVGAYSRCTTPWTLVGLDNGYHALEVRAVSVSDGADASAALWEWTAQVLQPDMKIKRPPDAAFVGEDIYYVEGGTSQSKTVKVRRGSKAVFQVAVENEGIPADDLYVHCNKPPRGFKVAFKLEGANVTAAVLTGSGLLRTYDPGQVRVFTMTVKVSTKAKVRALAQLAIAGHSEADSSAKDVVLARVIAKA